MDFLIVAILVFVFLVSMVFVSDLETPNWRNVTGIFSVFTLIGGALYAIAYAHHNYWSNATQDQKIALSELVRDCPETRKEVRDSLPDGLTRGYAEHWIDQCATESLVTSTTGGSP